MRASAPLLACTAVAFATLSLCGCGSKRIDQAAAWAIVDTVEQETRHSEFDQIKSHLSADCKIHEVAPDQNGTMQTTDKPCGQALDEGHRQLVEAALHGMTHDYGYQIQVVQIEGPKAVAHLSTTESLIGGGHSIKTSSDEVETLQMRDGKLMITAIDEKATSLEVDGRQVL